MSVVSDLYLVRDGCGLHAGGSIDGIAKNAILRHLGSNDAGSDRTRVHTDANPKLVCWQMRYLQEDPFA